MQYDDWVFFTLCIKKDAKKYVIVKQLDHASIDEIAVAIENELKESDETAEVEIYSGQNDPIYIDANWQASSNRWSRCDYPNWYISSTNNGCGK